MKESSDSILMMIVSRLTIISTWLAFSTLFSSKGCLFSWCLLVVHASFVILPSSCLSRVEICLLFSSMFSSKKKISHNFKFSIIVFIYSFVSCLRVIYEIISSWDTDLLSHSFYSWVVPTLLLLKWQQPWKLVNFRLDLYGKKYCFPFTCSVQVHGEEEPKQSLEVNMIWEISYILFSHTSLSIHLRPNYTSMLEKLENQTSMHFMMTSYAISCLLLVCFCLWLPFLFFPVSFQSLFTSSFFQYCYRLLVRFPIMLSLLLSFTLFSDCCQWLLVGRQRKSMVRQL